MKTGTTNPVTTKLLKLLQTSIRSGQNLNTLLRDILTGSVLFRHSSQADDNARQIQRAREQDRAARHARTQDQDRLDQALTRLEDRISQREAPRKK